MDWRLVSHLYKVDRSTDLHDTRWIGWIGIHRIVTFDQEMDWERPMSMGTRALPLKNSEA